MAVFCFKIINIWLEIINISGENIKVLYHYYANYAITITKQKYKISKKD